MKVFATSSWACLSFVAFVPVVLVLDGCDEELETGCGEGFLEGSSRKCSPAWDPVCGNGVVEWPEECDDANDGGGDGCEPNCTIIPVCGNSVTEPGEDCDDGNKVSADGCEESCSFLELDFEAICTVSTPVLDEAGRIVLGDDNEPMLESTVTVPLQPGDTCTFYLSCPAPAPSAFPVEVQPLPVVIAAEGETRVRLEQTLFVTSAVRASLPQLDEVRIEGGAIMYSVEADSDPIAFVADVIELGPLALPAPGESSVPIALQNAEVDFPHDGTSTFMATLTGLELEVGVLADALACSAVGEAALLFAHTN